MTVVSMDTDPVAKDQMTHRVAIVADRQFGDRLQGLAKRMHVWICDTSFNRPAIERVWRDHPDFGPESGATAFKVSDEASDADLVIGILADVDLHHGGLSHDPPWTVIEVYGCPPTRDVLSALSDYGATVTGTLPNGFSATRADHTLLR